MSRHLGYPSGAAKPAAVAYQRNGMGPKTVLTEGGPTCIQGRQLGIVQHWPPVEHRIWLTDV
jgi:hypothetical protein